MLTLSVSSELGLGKGTSETLGVMLARYPQKMRWTGFIVTKEGLAWATHVGPL